MPHPLTDYADNPVFDSGAVPTVLLDGKRVIRAVNPAYLQATGRSRQELLDCVIFEAFPANPLDPAGDGVAELDDSVGRAMRTNRRHSLSVLRYDITHSARSTEYAERYWAPVTTPVLDGKRLLGVRLEVPDITALQGDLQQVVAGVDAIIGERASGPENVADGDRVRPESLRSVSDLLEALLSQAVHHQALAREVLQLREALVSRATIDQAKGIVIAQQGCTPDEAFESLRRLSNDTNVRLQDVAAALVYRAAGAGRAEVRAARSK